MAQRNFENEQVEYPACYEVIGFVFGSLAGDLPPETSLTLM